MMRKYHKTMGDRDLNIALGILNVLSGNKATRTNVGTPGFTGGQNSNQFYDYSQILNQQNGQQPDLRGLVTATAILWGGERLGLWKIPDGQATNTSTLAQTNANGAAPPFVYGNLIRVGKDDAVPTVLNTVPVGSTNTRFLTYLNGSTSESRIPMAWAVLPDGRLTNGTQNYTQAEFTQLLMHGPQAAGQPSLMQGVLQLQTTDQNVQNNFNRTVHGTAQQAAVLNNDQVWITQFSDFDRFEVLGTTGIGANPTAGRGGNNLQGQAGGGTAPQGGNSTAGQPAPSNIDPNLYSLSPAKLNISNSFTKEQAQSYIQYGVGNSLIQYVTFDMNGSPRVWSSKDGKLTSQIGNQTLALDTSGFMDLLMSGQAKLPDGQNFEMQKNMFSIASLKPDILKMYQTAANDPNSIKNMQPVTGNSFEIKHLKDVRVASIAPTAPATGRTNGAAAPAGGTGATKPAQPNDTQSHKENAPAEGANRVDALAGRIEKLAADYWDRKPGDKGIESGWEAFKTEIGRENLPVGIANHIQKYLDYCKTNHITPHRTEAHNPFNPESEFSLRNFLKDELNKPGADLNKLEKAMQLSDDAQAAAIKTAQTYSGTPQRPAGESVSHNQGKPETKPPLEIQVGGGRAPIPDQKPTLLVVENGGAARPAALELGA